MTDSLSTVEPAGDATFGPCPCCGDPTRRVWGFAQTADGTRAAYFIQWVPGAVLKHGASFDLIVGRWGDDAVPADRSAVSMAFRYSANGPEFMVIDAQGRYHADPSVAATALSRGAVLNSSIAQEAYAIVDAIWLSDARVGELIAPAG